MREKRREQGQDEVKLMFIDVKKAHFNAKFDEEEWVEFAGRIQEVSEVCQAVEMIVWSEEGSVRMGG